MREIKRCIFGLEKQVREIRRCLFGLEKQVREIRRCLFGLEKQVREIRLCLFGLEEQVREIRCNPKQLTDVLENYLKEKAQDGTEQLHLCTHESNQNRFIHTI